MVGYEKIEWAEFRDHGTVRKDLFGGIAVNKHAWSEFAEQADHYGMSLIRFPGGTISEVGRLENGKIVFGDAIDFADLQGSRAHLAYDITHKELMSPELLTGREIGGLRDALVEGAENGAAVGIILPVERYYTGLDVTDAADLARMEKAIEADVAVFAANLRATLSGMTERPPEILLEIGNERYGNPIEYAFAARFMIEAIAELRDDFPVDLKIALQGGTGSLQFARLQERGYFDTFYDGGKPLIPELSGLGLDLSGEMAFRDRITAADQAMASILGDSLSEIDILRRHILDFKAVRHEVEDNIFSQGEDIRAFWEKAIVAAGGSAPEDYVSAWSVSSDGADQAPFSLTAAAHVSEMIEYLVAEGVDYAAAWGFMGTWDYFPDRAGTNALTAYRDGKSSPAAETFGLLSQVLTDGAQLLSRDVVEGEGWSSSVYHTGDRMVFVLSPETAALAGQRLQLELPAGVSLTDLRLDRVQTVDGTAAGLGEVVREKVVVKDGKVQIDFGQAHEVVLLQASIPGGFAGLGSKGAVFVGDAEGSAHDHLVGTDGDDEVSGLSGRDQIEGQGGSDYLIGGTGDDSVSGGEGNDTILGNTASDRLSGGGGSDAIYAGDGADVAWGDAGDDLILGRSGVDTLYGGSGDDRLDGNMGADLLYGGAGADALYGGTGWDSLDGGAGDDRLWGNEGSDRMRGGTGRDTLAGGSGDDDLRGGDGADTLYGNQGQDRLDGGTGDDVLRGGTLADTFVFAAGGGRDVIEDFELGQDRLLLDMDRQDLAQHATVTDLGLELAFGADTITLLGVTGLNGVDVEFV